MKAIRGDNPRTTNQRVYLMPVVPSPPPGKAPDARRGTVFSLFPSRSLSFYMPLFYLSVYLFVSLSISPLTLSPPLLPSFLLVLSAYRASCLSFSLSLSRRPSTPFYPPLRSRSRVITLLLSDMSLCYRHNQPVLFSLCFSSRALTRWSHPPRRTSPQRYLQRVVRSRIPAI